MPCTRSTACAISQIEGRLSVPGAGCRYLVHDSAGCLQMPNDLANSILRYATCYDRGVLTPHEFVHQILDLLIAADPPPEKIAEAFTLVPDAIMPTMKSELQEFVDADFYRRWFSMGDTRPEAQVHADALARQASLRRICGTLTPLVLLRDQRQAQ